MNSLIPICGAILLGFLLPTYVGARDVKMIQEIQFLTSDATLGQMLVGENLIQRFGVKEQPEAVAKLRGMLNLIESGDGQSLDIQFFGTDYTEAFWLTNRLAEIQQRGRGNFEKTVRQMAGSADQVALRALLDGQQNLHEQVRVNLINAMNALAAFQNSPDAGGGEQSTKRLQELVDTRDRARLAFDQQMDVLSYVRDVVAKACRTPDPSEPLKADPSAVGLVSAPLIGATAIPTSLQSPGLSKNPAASGGFPFAMIISLSLNVLLIASLLFQHWRKS